MCAALPSRCHHVTPNYSHLRGMTGRSLPAAYGCNKLHSSNILILSPSPRLLSAQLNACLGQQPPCSRSRAHVEQQVRRSP